MEMNYKRLENIKDDQLSKVDISKLDDWLSMSPYRDRNNLSFVKFAKECEVDMTTSLNLFLKASEVGVIKLTYKVKVENEILTFDNIEEVPVEIKQNNIEIRFKLISYPRQSMVSYFRES